MGFLAQNWDAFMTILNTIGLIIVAKHKKDLK